MALSAVPELAPFGIESVGREPVSGAASTVNSCCSSPLLVRDQKRRSSFALVAQDLSGPLPEEARQDHERSQVLLRSVLEHRGIRRFRAAPFVDQAGGGGEAQDATRYALVRTVLDHLKKKMGIHAARALRIQLHTMDENGLGVCPVPLFDSVLRTLCIRLKTSETQTLLHTFCTEEDQDLIDWVLFFSYLRTNWTTQREEVVREAYDELSRRSPGSHLTMGTLQRCFRPSALKPVHVPTLFEYEHESRQEFFRQWFKSVLQADATVEWVDFVDYFLDVSACMDSTQDFCTFVCESWGIDIDDILAKKVFLQFQSDDQANILTPKDFLRMLNELDPTITDVEALAWFEAISEHSTGEVTLDDFLNSKVLKLKRLFEQYDHDDSRSATKEEFFEILRALNPSITSDEATSLYMYADPDNDGEVSFTEFLKDRVLKVITIFDEFDADGGRTFSEHELKGLLRRLDPHLDDHEVHRVYKAIDVDGSSKISFNEFVESHFLRAKTLFDRYDLERCNSISHFKFRELLLDLDPLLTVEEVETIYALVCEENSGKVTIGGFLNPNIVKLKRLFDKYDADRSRRLDANEFRGMLRELFTGASEEDLQTIVAACLPPGCEQEVSYTAYIKSFAEIQRAHDAIALARRRESKEKARSKGLVWKG